MSGLRLVSRNDGQWPPAPPTGGITHGQDVTRSVVGPRITEFEVIGPASSSASDFIAPGGTMEGVHFTGTFHPDIESTYIDCLFDERFNNQSSARMTMAHCAVSPTAVFDWALGPKGVDAELCLFEGCSDGVRFEDMNLLECFIRTRLQSPEDHNDGIQAYLAGSGGSIIRCNIDCRPIDAEGVQTTDNGTTTGAIFLADSSEGETAVRGNYLAGGNGTLRLHENMYYRVTDNIVVADTWSSTTGPVSTSASRVGAFLEWADNRLSDGTPLAAP